MNRVSTSGRSHLQEQLAEMGRWYASYDDDIASLEIHDLLDKLSKDELTLSFCGHFSAGKSSLINNLCGRGVLLSGPMPTTANVAALRNGKRQVLLTPGNMHEASEDGGLISNDGKIAVSSEQMDQYCRDGTMYSMIEIWDDIPLLEKNGVLLDTPGVDSGDAAHALATNSALHLADVVFYVMDYNHVLSESNLTFAKVLADWGKPLYLVVNQIDKHREEELSFDTYRSSVESAFELWGIGSAGIFYISLKESEHPLNMLDSLRDTVTFLLKQQRGLLEYSISRSLQHGVEQFLERIQADETVEYENCMQNAGGEDSLESIHIELRELQLQLGENGSQRDFLRKKLADDLDSLLGSVQLMTPGLREAAQLFLESRQPGFKTGLLFQKGKTEREQDKRKAEFLERLKEQTSAQLDWHVRDLLRKFGKTHGVWGPDWERRMDAELPRCEESWITGPARAGAVVSGEYTLRYSADVAAEISGRYRRAALSLADGLLEVLAPRLAEAQGALAMQQQELLARAAAAERAHALRTAARERAAQLHALLGAPPSLPPGILPEVRDVPALPPRPQPGPAAAAPQAPAPAEGLGSAQRRGEAAPAPGRGRLKAAAAVLEAAAAELAPYPSFGSGVRELTGRAARLRAGRFTIALFGAFSAGKSSFANALLGAQVLPVSPHPTTAAINRILAPVDGIPHGHAVITFKSQDALENDLAYSFDSLQLGAWNSRSWQKDVGRLKASDIPSAGRAHYSFLKAAAVGWEMNATRLGEKETVKLEHFAPYVAEESMACFVDSVDLYYSCPLTEQGIVIVDTPGADSIHARHTGVTFQYMKNCDALLYVTYYNHAFSRADRQFLAHLGRVKGSFALDKMYFIVNASDLASTPQELESVINHVEDGLRGAGIESPQIYGVSSHTALEAKRSNDSERLEDSGFTRFEDSFLNFIDKELAGLTIKSAANDLRKWIDRAEQRRSLLAQGQEDTIRQRQTLYDDRQKYGEKRVLLSQCNKTPEIDQEIDELLFHVRQRLLYLANDLFHEYFHPSLLQETGGDMKRKFAATFHGYLAQLSIELSREIQATSLRMETKCQSMLSDETKEWIVSLSKELSLYPPLVIEFSEAWATPEIAEGMLDHSLISSDYVTYFKNPKAFFEGGGKQRLRDVLGNHLEAEVKQAVEQSGAKLYSYYRMEMARRFASLASLFEAEWDEWEAGMLALTDNNEDEEMWRSITDRLMELYKGLSHK
ncbi:Bacterial dynamin-like protein [compost metagenome]